MNPENPPAFACPGSEAVSESGMSLLDYFAGQALAGRLANSKYFTNCENSRLPANLLPAVISKHCYDFAEAMLTERQKRNRKEQ